MSIATKLDRVVTYHEGLHLCSHLNPLSSGLAQSCDKLKLYFHYHSNYEHQTW